MSLVIYLEVLFVPFTILLLNKINLFKDGNAYRTETSTRFVLGTDTPTGI